MFVGDDMYYVDIVLGDYLSRCIVEFGVNCELVIFVVR